MPGTAPRLLMRRRRPSRWTARLLPSTPTTPRASPGPPCVTWRPLRTCRRSRARRLSDGLQGRSGPLQLRGATGGGGALRHAAEGGLRPAGGVLVRGPGPAAGGDLGRERLLPGPGLRVAVHRDQEEGPPAALLLLRRRGQPVPDGRPEGPARRARAPGIRVRAFR